MSNSILCDRLLLGVSLVVILLRDRVNCDIPCRCRGRREIWVDGGWGRWGGGCSCRRGGRGGRWIDWAPLHRRNDGRHVSLGTLPRNYFRHPRSHHENHHTIVPPHSKKILIYPFRADDCYGFCYCYPPCDNADWYALHHDDDGGNTILPSLLGVLCVCTICRERMEARRWNVGFRYIASLLSICQNEGSTR